MSVKTQSITAPPPSSKNNRPPARRPEWRDPSKDRAHYGFGAMRTWTWLVAGLAFCSVLVGGAVHFGHTGPSISMFHAVDALLPPFSPAAWQAVFAEFHALPAFRLSSDSGMPLSVFEANYDWEWIRVSLTRLTYISVIVGGLFVLFRAGRDIRVSRGVGAIFVVVAVQAMLDHMIAAAGLQARSDMSQIPYAVHLLESAILFGCAILVGRWKPEKAPRSLTYRLWPLAVAGLLVLVFAGLVLGGLADGLHAEGVYNRWPLLDGAGLPPDLWLYSPWWKNLLANPLTVQVLHRLLTYAMVIGVALLGWKAWRSRQNPTIRRHVLALVLCAAAGTTINIASLDRPADAWLGLGHLAVTLILIGLLADFIARFAFRSVVHEAATAGFRGQRIDAEF